LSGNNRAMSDESQIHIPPSFVALFVPPGRSTSAGSSGPGKPTAARATIAARYEICEDLAHLLTDRAATIRWELGVTPADVLERIQRGLLAEGSGVDELLEWDRPD
jgi:hypothetical protein